MQVQWATKVPQGRLQAPLDEPVHSILFPRKYARVRGVLSVPVDGGLVSGLVFDRPAEADDVVPSADTGWPVLRRPAHRRVVVCRRNGRPWLLVHV
jgi:hypothetical protein